MLNFISGATQKPRLRPDGDSFKGCVSALMWYNHLERGDGDAEFNTQVRHAKHDKEATG